MGLNRCHDTHAFKVLVPSVCQRGPFVLPQSAGRLEYRPEVSGPQGNACKRMLVEHRQERAKGFVEYALQLTALRDDTLVAGREAFHRIRRCYGPCGLS